MASWPLFATRFLPRHPQVDPNCLSSPGKNISPWRALNFKNMVSRTHSCPLARQAGQSYYGELWFSVANWGASWRMAFCNFTYATATEFAMVSWPLLLFLVFFLDSSLVQSFLAQLGQVRYKEYRNAFYHFLDV